MGYMNRPDTDYWHKRNMGSMRRSNSGHVPGRNMGHMQGWDMPGMSRRNIHDRRGMDRGHMHDMLGMPMMRMMNQRYVMMQEHMARMEKSLGNIESLLQQLVEQQKN